MKQKAAYIRKLTKDLIHSMDGDSNKLQFILPYFLSQAYDEGRNHILDRVKEITTDPLPVAIDKLRKESNKKIKPIKRP